MWSFVEVVQGNQYRHQPPQNAPRPPRLAHSSLLCPPLPSQRCVPHAFKGRCAGQAWAPQDTCRKKTWGHGGGVPRVGSAGLGVCVCGRDCAVDTRRVSLGTRFAADLRVVSRTWTLGQGRRWGHEGESEARPWPRGLGSGGGDEDAMARRGGGSRPGLPRAEPGAQAGAAAAAPGVFTCPSSQLKAGPLVRLIS